MFDHTTPVRDWLWPILLIPLGGLLAIKVWIWAGVWMTVVAFAMVGWFYIESIYGGASLLERERTDKIEADIKLYKLMLSMTPDERQQFGLGSVKDTVKLEITNTEDSGTYSKDYHILSVTPAQLRAVAYSCRSGTPFTTRALSGAGKILSEGEFDGLRDELLEYDLLAYRSEKDHRQGQYWTELGQDFLKKVVENPV